MTPRKLNDTELSSLTEFYSRAGENRMVASALRELQARRAAEPVPPSPQPGTPLTLEQAVGVLNERRHQGFAAWQVMTNGDVGIGEPDEYLDYEFDPFEAIAVAEKYLRDAATVAEPQPGTWQQDWADAAYLSISGVGDAAQFNAYHIGTWPDRDAMAQEGARDDGA